MKYEIMMELKPYTKNIGFGRRSNTEKSIWEDIIKLSYPVKVQFTLTLNAVTSAYMDNDSDYVLPLRTGQSTDYVSELQESFRSIAEAEKWLKEILVLIKGRIAKVRWGIQEELQQGERYIDKLKKKQKKSGRV